MCAQVARMNLIRWSKLAAAVYLLYEWRCVCRTLVCDTLRVEWKRTRWGSLQDKPEYQGLNTAVLCFATVLIIIQNKPFGNILANGDRQSETGTCLPALANNQPASSSSIWPTFVFISDNFLRRIFSADTSITRLQEDPLLLLFVTLSYIIWSLCESCLSSSTSSLYCRCKQQT